MGSPVHAHARTHVHVHVHAHRPRPSHYPTPWHARTHARTHTTAHAHTPAHPRLTKTMVATGLLQLVLNHTCSSAQHKNPQPVTADTNTSACDAEITAETPAAFRPASAAPFTSSPPLRCVYNTTTRGGHNFIPHAASSDAQGCVSNADVQRKTHGRWARRGTGVSREPVWRRVAVDQNK